MTGLVTTVGTAVASTATAVTPHTTATAAPSIGVVAAGAAVAAVLVLGLWSLAGHVITVAHEGGHALMALLLGGRVHQVRLNRDRTGSTHASSALLHLPVTAAGYVAPSAFGLGGALLLTHGRADAVLGISVALLVLLLLVTATWFGRLVLVAAGAGLGLALVRGSPDVRVLVACTWVWLLLLGGVAHVWGHRRGGADFAALRRSTVVVPAAIWAGLALAASGAALLAGAAWLTGTAAPPL